MTANPTPEQIRKFLADCNLRRHGWDRFQHGTRRSALRMVRAITEESKMPRYEVRTIAADPTVRAAEFWQEGGPDPVHYVYDTVKDEPVPLSSTHDKAVADRDCARRNTRA